MELCFEPARLTGSVKAIPSKSAAHRLLICAALADRSTRLLMGERSKDIDATIRCLTALGAQVRTIPNGLEVLPPEGLSTMPLLDCGESGSTLRFLLPVAGALGCGGRFTGGGRLPERPLSPFREELESHGCTLSPAGSWPLELTGQLTAGSYRLPGNISSQYFTGLLLALPLLPGDSEIIITSPLESQGYIQMTLDAMAAFGVHARREGDRYLIPGNQRYHSPGTVAVEGDWSNAAFWLTAGILTGPVEVTGLLSQSGQGDRAILSLLKQWGGSLSAGDGKISAARGDLLPQQVDASAIPDLVPILAVLAAVTPGTTHITGAARLRLKESDRLAVMASCLNTLGGQVEELPDGLVITGVPHLGGGRVHSANDHRVVMAMAVAATVSEGPVTVCQGEAVEKSYPGFVRDYIQLGGSAHVADDRT